MTPRVALTHSEGRLEGLGPALDAAGYEVLRTPLIATRARRDPASVDRARGLLGCAWLLVTSRSTVEAWRELGLPWAGEAAGEPTSGPDGAAPDAPPRPRIGAIGPKTAAALADAGARVDLIADPATAHGLAAAFLRHPDARGPVGLPQGNRARPDLAEALEGAGLEVRTAVVYDTVAQPWPGVDAPSDTGPGASPEGAHDAAGSGAANDAAGSEGADAVAGVGAPEPESDAVPDAIVLASPSALEALPASVARAARLVALGPTTAEAIRAHGYRAVTADDPDPASVVRAVARALDASGPVAPRAAAVRPATDRPAPEETA